VAVDQALRDSARRLVIARADNGREVTRAQAIEAMQRGLGEAGGGEIVARLNADSPLVRYAAAMAAGELRLQAAYPTLLRLVADRDPSVRVAALFALHRLGDTRQSHLLVKLADQGDPVTRGSAVLALGLLNETSAIPALEARRNDDVIAVRLQAIEGLWRLSDTRARDTLMTLLISQYPDDRLFAVNALGTNPEAKDSAVFRVLRGKLTETDSYATDSGHNYVALAAARSLGRLGDDRGYTVAADALDSSDPRDRVLAALALGDIGRRDAQPLLKPLLNDRDPSVQVAAAQAILQVTR
jgi:HEAT repeat protein